MTYIYKPPFKSLLLNKICRLKHVNQVKKKSFFYFFVCVLFCYLRFLLLILNIDFAFINDILVGAEFVFDVL